MTAQRLEVFEMAHRRSMSETRQTWSRAPVIDVSDVMSALGGTFLTGTTRVALLSGDRARRLPEWQDPETHEVWETLLDGMRPGVLVNLIDWLRSVHERLGGSGQSQLPSADLIELYGRFACRLFAYGAITLRQESDSLSGERAHAVVPNASSEETPRLDYQGDPP